MSLALVLLGAGTVALLYRRNLFPQADVMPLQTTGTAHSYASYRTTPGVRKGVIHGRGVSYKGNRELLVSKGSVKKEWVEHHDREDHSYDIGFEAFNGDDAMHASIEYQAPATPCCQNNVEAFFHPGEAYEFSHGHVYDNDDAKGLVQRRLWNRAARDPAYR